MFNSDPLEESVKPGGTSDEDTIEKALPVELGTV